MLVNKYQKLSIRQTGRQRVILFFTLSFLALIYSFLPPGLFAQEKIAYDDKGRRDPFIALVTPDGRLLNLEPVGTDAKIVLEGIIYDDHGRSYAIINKEIVSIGDYILGQAVFKIEKNKVILLKDNQQVEYKLEKEEQ